MLHESEIKAFPKSVARLNRFVESGALNYATRDINWETPYMIYGQLGQEENMARMETMNNKTGNPEGGNDNEVRRGLRRSIQDGPNRNP